MTTGRADATATLLGDGRVLLAGGDNPSGLASAELYDPSTRGWSATGSMTSVHARGVAVLLRTGGVLVAGGANAPTGDVYSPGTGTWTVTGPLVDPYLQDSAAALLPDGQVLYAGGSRTACGYYCYYEVYADAELYTP
jgi:hypothetical protein